MLQNLYHRIAEQIKTRKIECAICDMKNESNEGPLTELQTLKSALSEIEKLVWTIDTEEEN